MIIWLHDFIHYVNIFTWQIISNFSPIVISLAVEMWKVGRRIEFIQKHIFLGEIQMFFGKYSLALFGRQTE